MYIFSASSLVIQFFRYNQGCSGRGAPGNDGPVKISESGASLNVPGHQLSNSPTLHHAALTVHHLDIKLTF